MNFAGKYEILEPVTHGSVETFLARIIATDDRVLVHIFECPEKRPDQPTVQWVLDSFHAVAPDTPELVLGTGTYSGTSYAYMVTKLPDSAALQRWIRAYETQEGAGETTASAESAATPQDLHPGKNDFAPGILGSDQPTVIRQSRDLEESSTVPEDLRSNGNVPSEISDAPSARKTDAAGMAATIIEVSRTNFGPVRRVELRERGESAGQSPEFEKVPDEPAHSGESGTQAQEEQPISVTPTDDVSVLIARSSTPIGVGPLNKAPTGTHQASAPVFANPAAAGPTDLFSFSDAHQSRNPLGTVSNPASEKKDDPKTGEFTGFFRGPFHGERSSQTPDLSPSLPQPQKQPSEFTKIFGASEEAPPLHREVASPSRLRDVPFRDDPGESPSNFESASQTEVFIEWPLPTATVRPKPPIDSPAQLAVPEVSGGKIWHDAKTAFTFRSAPECATSVFSAPGNDLPLGSPTPQTVPSDFTRIISGGSREPAPVEEPPMPTMSHDGFIGKLAPPAGASSLPASSAAAPPAPQFNQPDQPKMPVLPGVSAPPAPSASQLKSAQKAAGPPWTLIIVINVLFIVAVLLILYFVLKH